MIWDPNCHATQNSLYMNNPGASPEIATEQTVNDIIQVQITEHSNLQQT
jgi:hypothetical protein